MVVTEQWRRRKILYENHLAFPSDYLDPTERSKAAVILSKKLGSTAAAADRLTISVGEFSTIVQGYSHPRVSDETLINEVEDLAIETVDRDRPARES